MIFRVSGRGRAGAGRARRRKMAVARLGDGAPRRRRPFIVWLMIPRLLLLRSRRALALLREYYAEMMRRLVAEAAALEPAKARDSAADASLEPATAAVVPAAVARMVLRCNCHYYIR